MSCCNNYLGRFPHNEDIRTGVFANATGEFIFKFDYLGAGFGLTVDGVDGEELVIQKGFLNENFTYRFTIVDPNGDNIEIYDCENFSLKTYTNINTCQDDCDTSFYL